MTGPAGVNQPSFSTMRGAMVDSQLRTTGVNDPRVVDAIAEVPRERFVPANRAMLAYVDEDIEIAPGRWLIEPLVFGRLLTAARISARDRVLIVGAGSGYSAAVVARLAGDVVAVEQDAALAATARGNLAALDVGNATVVDGPLSAGAPGRGPFDIIVVDGAVEVIPDALVGQLRDGGRLVGVLVDAGGFGRAVVGTRASGGFATTSFMEASVGALPGFGRVKRFAF